MVVQSLDGQTQAGGTSGSSSTAAARGPQGAANASMAVVLTGTAGRRSSVDVTPLDIPSSSQMSGSVAVGGWQTSSTTTPTVPAGVSASVGWSGWRASLTVRSLLRPAFQHYCRCPASTPQRLSQSTRYRFAFATS